MDGDFDAERWEDLSILLYHLRGNDGCNIKPIVVVSKTPPSVQDLIVWRSVDVYVTEGCISDKGVARHLVGRACIRAHTYSLTSQRPPWFNPNLTLVCGVKVPQRAQ